MTLRNLFSLLIFFLLVGAIAWTAAQFEPGSWYQSLEKPTWTPPDRLFGPVWSVLYICIAIAGWLVWRDSGGSVSFPLTLWVAQLALNGIWSWVFFGMQEMLAGLIIISSLLLVLLAFFFRSRNRTASLLFLPYVLWIAYATMLNLEIYRINP